MSSNLAAILTETAGRHGDRPALKLDDTVVTYEQLDEGSARLAGLLKAKGVEPGDRVGIMLPNVPYFGVVYYGVLRAGGGNGAAGRTESSNSPKETSGP